MIPDQNGSADGADKFDDEHYPAYTMGRAADMLGATQGFLRSLDEAGLITPQRSAGGHRRYSGTSSAWPPGCGNWSIRAPPSRPPAASSPSKTSSTKPSASTPNSAPTAEIPAL